MLLFLDMDGVLADFIRGVQRWLRSDIRPTRWEYWEDLGITEDQFDRLVESGGAGFWRNLPLCPFAADLLLLVKQWEMQHPAARWWIATKPMKHADCWIGKVRWAERLGLLERLIPIREKVLLAGDGRVLVDDNRDNCDQWELMGGTAVLWPTMANTPHADVGWRRLDAAAELREVLGLIQPHSRLPDRIAPTTPVARGAALAPVGHAAAK